MFLRGKVALFALAQLVFAERATNTVLEAENPGVDCRPGVLFSFGKR